MNGREALSRVLAIASEALDDASDNIKHGEYPYGDALPAREQYEHDSKCLSAAANIVWRIEPDEEY